MLIHAYGAKCIGIDAVKVTVEVNMEMGIGIHLVGLADVAVKESLLRTTTALSSLGFRVPGKKIIINLAPADLHKSGSGYDLPIAVGVIAASSQRELPLLERFLLMGELGLNGEIRAVSGALSVADLASREGLDGCILPLESAMEAVEYTQTAVYGVRNLEEVFRILSGTEDASDLLVWNSDEARQRLSDPEPPIDSIDFSEIIGQQQAKRGVEIAVAGSHNILLLGPPGSGKSSLAKAIPGIMPPMSLEESIVTSKIYSVSGRGASRLGLVRTRPFRCPHYSASIAAIIGGGSGDNVLPGEVSLSQNGVFFADEFGQMPKNVVEALRGPLEDRKVVISRLKTKVEYPASFMLVAASNPCPCGYWGDGDRCTCTPQQRATYLNRLSGPIMDRLDLHVWMNTLDSSQILRHKKAATPVEKSADVAARILSARELQRRRYEGEGISVNAELNNRLMVKYCRLSTESQSTLASLMEKQSFSMRAYFRIIKVARTIADLAGKPDIAPEHIIEAAGFRFMDKERRF